MKAASYGAVSLPENHGRPPHVRISLCSGTQIQATDGGGGEESGGNKSGDGGGSGGGNWNNGDDDGNRRSFNLYQLYMALLLSSPLPTKMVTAAFISALSDIFAQLITGESEGDGLSRLNWRRVLAFGVIGLLFTAPIFHYLYEFLELRIPAKASWFNTGCQLAVDQLLGAPFWLFWFFSTLAFFEHLPDLNAVVRRTIDGYQRDFLPAMLLTWKIFIPTQTISFALLPTSTRVLALNIVDLVYTAALSYMSHKPHETWPAKS